MKLFKSPMLNESLVPVSPKWVLHYGPRYDRRRPHAPQILHLECLPLLQIGDEQVATREPANNDIHRAA